MAWTINYLKSVQKELKKTDKNGRERIREFLETKVAHLENPRDLGKPLKGNKSEFWRYRVGEYRIICSISDSSLTVLVVRIGHRKDVYRN